MKSFFAWIISLFSPKSPATVPPASSPVAPAPVVAPAPDTHATAPSAPVPTTTPSIPDAGGKIQPQPLPEWDGKTEVLFVDTAHYQDSMKLADWADLFKRGFRAMYPKAVDGQYGPDSYWAKSKEFARQVGMLCFAGYCFFRADQDPLAQANALVKVTGGVNPGELPCVVDFEWDNSSKDPGYHDRDHGGTRQMNDEKEENNLYICLCRVEELTGITPWLYGSTGYIRFKNPARFARFPFIVANYSSKTADGDVPLPAPWKRAAARQYSGSLKTASGDGIDGDRFLGSLDQLKAMVKK